MDPGALRSVPPDFVKDLCVRACNRGRKSELGLVGSSSGNTNSFFRFRDFLLLEPEFIPTDESKQNSFPQLLPLTSSLSSQAP